MLACFEVSLIAVSLFAASLQCLGPGGSGAADAVELHGGTGCPDLAAYAVAAVRSAYLDRAAADAAAADSAAAADVAADAAVDADTAAAAAAFAAAATFSVAIVGSAADAFGALSAALEELGSLLAISQEMHQGNSCASRNCQKYVGYPRFSCC